MTRIDVTTGGKPYSIIYDFDGDCLVIDGVKCSTDLIRQLICAPRADVLMSLERRGDTVFVHQHLVAVEGAK